MHYLDFYNVVYADICNVFYVYLDQTNETAQRFFVRLTRFPFFLIPSLAPSLPSHDIC